MEIKEEDIIKLENDFALNGAFEMDMESAYSMPKSWNILSVCKIDEEMSSRLLKFFLDPMETHNLGDLFLNSFLNMLNGGKNDYSHILKSKNLIIRCEPKAGIKAKTDKKHRYFDIEIKDNSNKICIEIENKTDEKSISDIRQVKEEIKQSHRKSKKEGFNLVIIFLLPNEMAYKNKIEHYKDIPNFDDDIKLIYWDKQIKKTVEELIRIAKDDYSLNALLHFRDFCLKVGGA